MGDTQLKFTSNLPDYPSDWPPQEFLAIQQQTTNAQFLAFKKLVDNNADETALDLFLRSNPQILSSALSFAHTGHHGAWVIPQQAIRPKIGNVQNGLIPDYIIGGKNSDGFQWWVVELKGANAKSFTQKKNDIAFSKGLNEGICQLLTYIDYCAEIQSSLRDQFGLKGFREPKGLILIGRESEFAENEVKQKLKSAWNRVTRDTIQIRTYDALLREVEHKATYFDVNPNDDR